MTADAQTPRTVENWRKELIRIAKCERPEITPKMAQAAMLHIETTERDLAAAKASLDKWEAAGRALHSDAETIVIVARETQEELAAAKAEAEELRKELADRPSIGMVQILKQTIKAEHDEAEALRDLLRECRRFVVERSWSGCASEEDANVCLANIDAAIDAARKG